MSRIALRYLWARKLRTFLTSLSVVLGVMMVTGTYVFTDTIDSSFEQIFTESNENIDAVVTAKETVDSEGAATTSFDAKALDEVRETEGVALAEGAIADPQVAIIGADGEPTGTSGAPTFAFSTGDDLFDPLDYEGRPRRPTTRSSSTSRRRSPRASRSATPSSSRARRRRAGYEVVGLGTLGGVDSFGGASFAVLTLPEAQRITGKEGEFDQIAISAEPDVAPDELVRELALALPDNVNVETGEENVQSQRDDIGELIGFLTTALLIFAGRRALRRGVPDLQHVLDHGRAAHPGVRDAARAGREPPADRQLGGAGGPRAGPGRVRAGVRPRRPLRRRARGRVQGARDRPAGVGPRGRDAHGRSWRSRSGPC